jgi:hypothetical protein
VLSALTDGPAELAPVLAQVFLHIIDTPKTRRYLTPGIDLEVSLSLISVSFLRLRQKRVRRSLYPVLLMRMDERQATENGCEPVPRLYVLFYVHGAVSA